MTPKLPPSVISQQDLAALTQEIRQYTVWYSHNSIKQRVNAKKGTPAPDLSPAALELIRSVSNKKLLTQSILDNLLTYLERLQKNSHHMTITLAAAPSVSTKQTLTTWCRDNISDQLLVTFKFNSQILGGMIIQYGSHMYDLSFRRKILENTAAFPEVLRRV